MTTPQNALIALLPRKDRVRLLALCQPVQLLLGDVLCERGHSTRYVYFPVDGFISLVTQVDDHPGVEVGMIGREGMLGVQLALGIAVEPLHALVQGSGTVLRIAAAPFRRELAINQPLQISLQRYLYVLMAQLAATASCLRFHLIGPRLARWLLMTQDRAHADQFHVTHEFLAYMLGVRRVGVTVAAGVLMRDGLVAYRRGEMTVIDRSGLEATACSCYATDQKIYSDCMH